MNLGIATFVNQNKKYLELLEVMIESVLKFTDLKIEVNSINFNYTHNSNRVINKRININHENLYTIYFSKILSCIQTEFDYALILDSDNIVTPEIMNLFNQENYDNIDNYVLGPRHPQYPIVDDSLIKYFDAPQTQPYVHGNFLFNKNSKIFLEEVYDRCYFAYNNGIQLPSHDETILNLSLWKHKLTDKYLYYFDPYYEVFLNRHTEKQFYDEEVKYYMCHGCKDPSIARNIFNQIN